MFPNLGSGGASSPVGSVAEPSDAAAPTDEEGGPIQPQVTKFTDDSGIFSPENTKAVLIDTAEKMVTALHDILTESIEIDGG